MTTKMGRVRAQTRQEPEIAGSARSERRLKRGPELGLGAAMRVRWAGRRACLGNGDCRRKQGDCWRIELCQLHRRELIFRGGILL